MNILNVQATLQTGTKILVLQMFFRHNYRGLKTFQTKYHTTLLFLVPETTPSYQNVRKKPELFGVKIWVQVKQSF